MQACNSSEEPVNDDSSDSKVEQTRDRDKEEASDANPDREQDSQASTVKPKVITKEVVVVAKPVDALPAELDSKNPNSKINIREKPTTQSRAKHFGYANYHSTQISNQLL